MPNPLIDQGTLNRVRGSVTWSSNPNLNVTAPYLGKEAIRLALQGKAVTYIPTMTGAVRSLEPYMMIELTIHLLKTQPLAAQYKARMELDSTLTDGTVRTDTSALGNYQIVNCSITGVRELSFAGEDPGFAVTVEGYYLVNSTLFN